MLHLDTVIHYYRRKLKLPISPRDVVLDVGSGGKPHPRANVLCERYVNSTRDRSGLGFDRQSKDVVIGDICNLPFRDHAFDYVICSHVVEHVDKPADAMRELQRVGRAGYIETPSELIEVLLDNPAHESVIRVRDKTLVFERKPKYPHQPAIRTQVRSLKRRHARWRRVLGSDECFVCYHWRGHVDFEIISGPETYQDCVHTGDAGAVKADPSEDWLRRVLRRRVLPLMCRYLYPDRTAYTFENLLCCPGCHGKLRITDKSIACSDCGRNFGYENGTPRLLLDEQAVSQSVDAMPDF